MCIITNILEFCVEPRSMKEIQQHLKIHSRSYLKINYIDQFIRAGKLVMTVPEKPNSPKKYIINQIDE